MSSAAATNRSKATSPEVMMPVVWAASEAAASNEPPVRAAPAMPMPLRKERRLTPLRDGDSVVSDDTVGARFSFVMLKTPVFSEMIVGDPANRICIRRKMKVGCCELWSVMRASIICQFVCMSAASYRGTEELPTRRDDQCFRPLSARIIEGVFAVHSA